MRLMRLLQAGLPELAGRARQEGSKWLERAALGAAPGGGRAPRLRPRHFDPELSPFRGRDEAGGRNDAALAARLRESFGAAFPGRFFPGAVSEETPELLAEVIPAARDEILRAAGAITARRFDLLGYKRLFFGNPVDWHFDPISSRRAPLRHWSRLDPLDPDATGDSKVIWELNRHQWLPRLGQAALLTGDEAYARTATSLLGDWAAANPHRLGINWASSLEAALRLIAWCWGLAFFRRSATLTPALFLEMLNGIRLHAAHVERYLSRYFSPNTHLTGEALGLVYAGLVCPELRAARRWRALGARILDEELEKQLLPDGVHFERSTCYHRYTTEIYLHYLVLAERNGLVVPRRLRERLERMLDVLLALRRPDGAIPSIGDADGGWLLPLADRAPEDARGLLSTAAALFERPDFAWAAGGIAPETIWMLGSEGWRRFQALRPQPPSIRPSALLPDAGYVVMRGGWDDEAHHLVFDAGPIGCPITAGHGHADLLSIQCSVFGRPFLVDPGTGSYASRGPWRDHFRGTAAHSTVMIDGRGQAEPAGAFSWQTRPRARLRRFVSNGTFDLADADHDAYARLRDPVIHRRRVIFVKPRYFILVDDLMGDAEHRVEQIFQFAPLRATLDASGWCRALGGRQGGLLIRSFCAAPLAASIVTGAIDPSRGWVSPAYGQRRPAPALIARVTATLPLRILTLLLPVRDPQQPPPLVAPLSRVAGGEPEGLRLEWAGGGSETVRLNELGFAVEGR